MTTSIFIQNFTLHRVNNSDKILMQHIGKLRVKTWIQSLPRFKEIDCWLDGFDETATHWCFLDPLGQPVAAARMSVHDTIFEFPEAETYSVLYEQRLQGPLASMNRLVVDPQFQNRGLATALDRVRIETAKTLGCRYIIGSTTSGQKRIAKLLSLGFEIKGMGHKVPMQKHMEVEHEPVILCLNLTRR